MKTDRIVLRPRDPGEAIELGLHLTRANWPAQIGLMLVMLIPLSLLGIALGLLFAPLALLALAWFKPTLDRALLHQLSNDLLGRPASVRTVLGEWRQWWFGGHLISLLWHRFNLGRGAVLPIWQLERLSGARRRQRARGLNRNDRGASSFLTLVAALIEFSIAVSVVVLLIALAPTQWTAGLDFWDWLQVHAGMDTFWWVIAGVYLPALALVEPFYIGASFGIYLNQRSRLECWDLEPQLDALVARHRVRSLA